MKQEKLKDFESALDLLEQKVRALEEGNLPLEESLKTFEEGMTIAQFCAQKLQAAEQRVQMLMRQTDGSVKPVPMPANPIGDTGNGPVDEE